MAEMFLLAHSAEEKEREGGGQEERLALKWSPESISLDIV